MPGQRDLVIGTAGHIDHGKTALVRALTGVDTDRLPAEKQRGITIDLGFASLELGRPAAGAGRRAGARAVHPQHAGRRLGARPGHAGRRGRRLGDAADPRAPRDPPDPRPGRRRGRADQVRPGRPGLARRWSRTRSGPWSRGRSWSRPRSSGPRRRPAWGSRTSKASLARLCDAAPDRDDPGLFRLAIDRSFTVAGHGTVVTGTVASGEVAVGDELEWFPEGRAVRVRGLHRHDRPVDRVGRGARAAINLGGRPSRRGRAGGTNWPTPGYLASARILSVEVRASAEAPRPLRHRGRYRVHLGTAEVSATLSPSSRTSARRGRDAWPS